MFISILTITFGFTLIASAARIRRARRRQRVLAVAKDRGLVVDNNGHVEACATLAAMSAHDRSGGVDYTGKQRRFLELMRICAEGPKSVEEIRFLFVEGINPVVRPDGLVYVPCIENEHLYMEGELELLEEDLERFLQDQLIRLDTTDSPATRPRD